MQDIECKINLIMFNPHAGTRFSASSMGQVQAFRAIIMQVALPSALPSATCVSAFVLNLRCGSLHMI